MAQSLLVATCPVFDQETETIEEFLERFTMLLEGDTKKKNDKCIAAHLIRALPLQLVTDLQRRLAPQKLTETSYDELIENLLQAHSVRQSVVGASVKFFTYKQRPEQSLEEYSKELRFLASKCNFEKNLTLDRLLRDVFIAGIRSSNILTSVLQAADKLSFPEAIEKAKMIHQVREDAIDMHHNQQSKAHFTDYSENDYESLNKVQSSRSPPPGYVCIRCGAKAKHFVDTCFAKSVQCNTCNKIGHISKVCRSNMTQPKASNRSRIHEVGDANRLRVSGSNDIEVRSGRGHHSLGADGSTAHSFPVSSNDSGPLSDINNLDHFLL